jgi:hypothetical protein
MIIPVFITPSGEVITPTKTVVPQQPEVGMVETTPMEELCRLAAREAEKSSTVKEKL